MSDISLFISLVPPPGVSVADLAQELAYLVVCKLREADATAIKITPIATE
jgi:hypothetical protein